MSRLIFLGGLLVAASPWARAQVAPTPPAVPAAPARVRTAPAPAPPLTGQVLDQATQQPLPGAVIQFPDLRQGAATDSAGRFSFSRLPRGRFLVQVRALGYGTIIRTVDTSAPGPLAISLAPTVAEIGQVIVTGVSASTEMRRSPVPTTAIDRHHLDQLAATNAIDALSRVPGINQITTGPGISKPVVRGLSANRLVTLNNGARQEGQQWGDEHGIELDENSFDRVEIIKGPGSLLYGSDALAGVINFLPPDPVAEGRILGTVMASYQTNARQQGYSVMNAGNLHGFTWLARGSGKLAGHYRNAADGRVYNSAFRELNANGYLGLHRAWGFSHVVFSSFNQRLGMPEGERDSLSGRFVREVENDRGEPVEEILTNDALRGYAIDEPYQQVNHRRVGLDNSFVVGASRLTATINYQQNLRREYGHDHAADADTAGGDGDHHEEGEAPALAMRLRTIDYAVRWFLPEAAGWQPTIGLSGMRQWNRNEGEEYLIPDYRLLDAGVFGVLKKSAGRLDLTAGLRYDLRRLQADALWLDDHGHAVPRDAPDAVLHFTGFTTTFRNVSASAGLAWNLTDKLTLKANAARGFRAPNIAELSSNGAHEGTNRFEVGSPGLRAETSLQLDAGVSYVADHVTLTLDAFHNRIRNYVFPRRLPTRAGDDSLSAGGDRVFRYDQGDARLYGGEASIDLHPHPLDWLHFENSFSLVRAGQLHVPAAQRYLPFIPADRLQSELRAQFAAVGPYVAQLYARVALEHTFTQHRFYAAYETETRTPAYTLLNAGIGADFTNRRRRTVCSLHVAATNLTDVAYQSHLSRLKYTSVNYATGRQGIFNMGRNISFRLVVPLSFK